jgi:predicted Zn-dependent peptidase
LARLDALLGQQRPQGLAVPPVPQPTGTAKPGVYLVDKKDGNQGRVAIGHLGERRPIPDEFAMDAANEILGGAGFTAWMMSRIRSDEGLAYGAYSEYRLGEQFPGDFQASFQSKFASCARAAALTVQLIGKLRAGGATEQDLATTKRSAIETFPHRFETKARTVMRFAVDDLVGRPHDYWRTYRANVAAVDLNAVAAAARSHIKPENLVVLVVGDVQAILKGEPDHPEARFENLGQLTRLPWRDPVTLRPMGK